MVMYELISQSRTEYLTDAVANRMLADAVSFPEVCRLSGNYLIVGTDVYRAL